MASKNLSGFAFDNGFSLLELLLVVSVGATLIVSGLSAYRQVMTNVNMNNTVQSMVAVQAQIDWAYGSRNFFPNGNMVDKLAALRSLPTDLPLVGTGEDMYIRSPTGIMTIRGQVQTYTMTLDGMPKATCIRLGQIYTPVNNNKLQELTINGTSFSTRSRGQFDNLQRELMTLCRDVAAENEISWVLR
jgi:prepilin-type N-terminal cleavage/methylation domain-containing protein